MNLKSTVGEAQQEVLPRIQATGRALDVEHEREICVSSVAVGSLLLVALILAVSVSSFAGVFISVGIAPPPLPVYEQPYCPGPGYIWTPGYWAYGPDGYFWVPGTWVLAPQVGYSVDARLLGMGR